MSKLQLPRPAGKQPAAAQPQPERPQVPLLETDPAKGLTAEQAAQRMAAGLDNRAAASPTRSETEIIRDNIFTFFNLVFIVLALCLALVGSFANMTFLGVVIANTIIGTVQQLRRTFPPRAKPVHDHGNSEHLHEQGMSRMDNKRWL